MTNQPSLTNNDQGNTTLLAAGMPSLLTRRWYIPQACYTPEWQQHVLSHLPFYTILLPTFLELTRARLILKPDPALLDLLQVDFF